MSHGMLQQKSRKYGESAASLGIYTPLLHGEASHLPMAINHLGKRQAHHPRGPGLGGLRGLEGLGGEGMSQAGKKCVIFNLGDKHRILKGD